MSNARIEPMPPQSCQDCQYCGAEISVDGVTNCEIYGRVNVADADDCPTYEEDE